MKQISTLNIHEACQLASPQIDMSFHSRHINADFDLTLIVLVNDVCLTTKQV